MTKKKIKPNQAKLVDKRLMPFKHGLHLNFKAVDKRSKLGKAIDALYSYLREYTGEETIITELLISRIVFKSIKLHLFESTSFAEPIQDLPKEYLSMSNSLRRDLAALARYAEQPETPNLDDYLKRVYGEHGDD